MKAVKKEKPLVINESLYAYTDEMYSSFYVCPNTGCTGELIPRYKFCPICGKAVVWDKALMAKIRIGLRP